jgi:Transglycosylase SLT domain
MSVDATGASAISVTGAIRQAAQKTGANFNYLLATARVESNLNPAAQATSSSAGGLFQFIEQTWLGTIKHAGPALGYGRYADAVSVNSSGRFEVQDTGLRQQIMNLRNDPSANALMAGALTKWNGDWLEAKLGRSPGEGELYLAHFLGAGGAGKLISLAASSPQASAADVFPRAAGPIVRSFTTNRASRAASRRSIR